MAYPVDPKSKPPGILVAQTEEDAGFKRLNYNLRCRASVIIYLNILSGVSLLILSVKSCA